jgi:hypothetical protein
MVQRHAMTPDAIALLIHRPTAYVEQRLALLDYPEALQAAVHAKRVPLSAAKWLAKVGPQPLQAEYIRHAVNHGVTAATARYWYEQAELAKTMPNNLAENHSSEALNTYETVTRVTCAICTEPTNILHTTNLRICEQCRLEIEAPRRPETTTDAPT